MHHMHNGRNRAAHIAKIVVMVLIFITVFTWVVMALWNWLVPPIIGWKSIDYWQAMGILVLSKILFGFGRFGGGGHWHWRARMAERWERMTPEEREKFREGMRQRCGRRGSAEDVTGG